jgi:endoglucanase
MKYVGRYGVLGLLLILAMSPAQAANLPYRGVNLSGADFCVSNLGVPVANPCVHGSEYIWPDPTYVSGYNSRTYYVGKGMNIFRLPFNWENIQPTLGAAFNSAEQTRLTTTVAGLRATGATVLLDIHNYARGNFGNIIGSGVVTNAHFANLWSRLATLYAGDTGVWFGLMNEPHDLPSTEQWVSAANAAIVAIRATGATNKITVPGNQFTAASVWADTFYGTSNAVALLNIVDSGNNMVFEAHNYLDTDASGTVATCVNATIGSTRLAPFTTWLEANGKQGFLAEFGAGDDATCLAAINDIVTYMEAHQPAYLGFTWFAGGPTSWWGASYFTLLEEISPGVDQPQMNTLEPHLLAPASGWRPTGLRLILR